MVEAPTGARRSGLLLHVVRLCCLDVPLGPSKEFVKCDDVWLVEVALARAAGAEEVRSQGQETVGREPVGVSRISSSRPNASWMTTTPGHGPWPLGMAR
jgi:hypothetical protein